MTVKLNEPYVLVKATRAPAATNPNPSLGPVGVDPTPTLKDTSFSDGPESVDQSVDQNAKQDAKQNKLLVWN